MKKYGFGVDIGGTTCKLGYFGMEGTLLAKWEIRTDTQHNGENIIDNIASEIHNKMQTEHITVEDVAGIGLDVPGPVGKDGIVQQCVNIGWVNYPAASLLHEKTHLPVKIGNDANVAALGEMWQGGGKGHLDMIMVTLGTGVGGAVIIDGKIVSGNHGIGGEIGHMRVNHDEKQVCGCGKTGCLEQYVSATGIARMTNEMLDECSTESVLRKEKVTARAVFDAAKAQDELAMQVVEKFGKILGTALGGLSCVVDPEIFVIGGGVSKAGEPLIEAVKKYFKEETLPGAKDMKFALASLENDAGIFGCVRMLLD